MLWALLADAGPALAQQDQGLVTGRVTDPSGAVVTATAANGATAKTRTNTDGH